MRHRSLPRLTIPIPCLADWRAMEPIAGDNRARLCRSCDRPVYDSKSMTRDQIYDLIAKTEGSPPCMQLHLRPDGTVVTKGCLAALWRTGRAVWLKAAALAVAFWAGVFGLRRACDTALAPAAVSLELTGPETIRGGLIILEARPARDPPWLNPPATKKVDPDHAEPLRRLQSEEELLPPGWR
jgi:hypothetical protein